MTAEMEAMMKLLQLVINGTPEQLRELDVAIAAKKARAAK